MLGLHPTIERFRYKATSSQCNAVSQPCLAPFSHSRWQKHHVNHVPYHVEHINNNLHIMSFMKTGQICEPKCFQWRPLVRYVHLPGAPKMSADFLLPLVGILQTLIPVWVSNYVPSKVWDEITNQFLNFNGATIEVWEWMSNFNAHFLMDVNER